MWLVVISTSDSISVIHNWKWMSNPANIVLKWVWTVIRNMLYIRWNHWCWQNRVINRVDQYCELQWNICVIEWIILSLFSDFHSITLLKTDELRIWYKRITHSIILLLFSTTIESETDRLSDWVCKSKNQSINQSIHELINDAHFMQWITIIRLSLLTNGTLLQGYCIFYHSFFQSFAFVFISWMHDWGIESMPILYAIIYPGPTNNKANNNSNNNEIGYANGHQYRWLKIWKWKWIQSQCLEQKENEMKSSSNNKMWISGDMSFVTNYWNANLTQYPISNNTIFVYNWNDNRNRSIMRKRKQYMQIILINRW